MLIMKGTQQEQHTIPRCHPMEVALGWLPTLMQEQEQKQHMIPRCHPMEVTLGRSLIPRLYIQIT